MLCATQSRVALTIIGSANIHRSQDHQYSLDAGRLVAMALRRLLTKNNVRKVFRRSSIHNRARSVQSLARSDLSPNLKDAARPGDRNRHYTTWYSGWAASTKVRPSVASDSDCYAEFISKKPLGPRSAPFFPAYSIRCQMSRNVPVNF